MALAIGNRVTKKLYRGDREVKKLYAGSRLLFEPGEITSHRIQLGAPQVVMGTNRADELEWRNQDLQPYPRIPAALVQGGVEAYFAYLHLHWNGTIILDTHNATTGNSQGSPSVDLAAAWETNPDDAIVLSASGNGPGAIVASLHGPNAPAVRGDKDSNEPYRWRLSNANRNEQLRPFLRAYDELTVQEQATTAITLNIPAST